MLDLITLSKNIRNSRVSNQTLLLARKSLANLLGSKEASRLKFYHRLILYFAATREFDIETSKKLERYLSWLGFSSQDFNPLVYFEKTQRELLYCYQHSLEFALLEAFEELKIAWYEIQPEIKTQKDLQDFFKFTSQENEQDLKETSRI